MNKPLNWTSNDVVQYLKHYFKFKKIGHAGTLDPLATGVLIIGIESGTKELTNLINQDKEYEVVIQLGILTKSFDLGTPVIQKQPISSTLSKKIISDTIEQYFINQEYLQYPPIYSAKKVDGRKLYEYAKKNQSVEIKPSHVYLYHFKVLSYDKVQHVIKLWMHVSKGFYIRSFAYDLGLKLNTYGTVYQLKRTRAGEFQLNQCYELKKKLDNSKV